MADLTPDEATALLYDWPLWARPAQTPPPGAWFVWLILAGRGFGKTRTGAEYIRAGQHTCPHMRVIAPTFADARDTCVEAESGLRSICAPGEVVKWNRSLGEVEFKTGATVKLFSADEPERLRGPQSYRDWYDELGAWRYVQQTWDMAMMGLRLGTDPRAVVTTTPRPIPLLKWLLAQPTTHTTRGSTYDNRANLAPQFFAHIVSRYEGTTLGRQELNAELLDDMPGALWRRSTIEVGRVVKAPPLSRVVTAIDPSATATGDEAGVVTAGVGLCACTGTPELHGFVLSDSSVQASPDKWAAAAVADYHKHAADTLVAEDNNGGEMVAITIGTVAHAPPVKRIHASRGKQTRAEPIAMLYEQGKVHHVGAFAKLEDELCSWLPGDASPNRMDALVWALTELMLNGAGGAAILDYYRRRVEER